jgi:hypothetical protein
VPVEVAAGLALLRVFELALVVGPTVGKTMSVGTLIVRASFGALAHSP